ncbi:MAG: PAS domain-containing sensor histidine kinase [Phycisphaerae bacterium]|nr:PAS domain-containing sensor histidine kinase [Phycisphaerae bacterium]
MLTSKPKQLSNRRVARNVEPSTLGATLSLIEKIIPDIDLTELKNLKHVQNSYQEILDIAPSGIGKLDIGGRVKYANAAFHKIFGYTAGELIGREIIELAADKKEISKLKKLIGSAIKGQHLAMPFEIKTRTKDGRVIDVHIHWDYSRDITGQINGFFGAVRDITQQKCAEQKIHRQILKQKELKKQVLEVSEYEKQLIGQELHDSIGQQLAGIGLMANVLKKNLEKLSSQHAKDAAHIASIASDTLRQARAIAHGMHLINLDFGSLEAALTQLCNNCQYLFGIECSLDCPTNVKPVDPQITTHLYRIAQEAITNAVKHGKAQHVKISVIGGKRKGVLSVENDGEDFQEDKRTGMGLRLIAHRVEMINGSFDVRKNNNGGTVLTSVFPTR